MFDAVDHLVDIKNATGYKNGKHQNVQYVDSPHHLHIYELLEILCLFTEWKKDAGGFNEQLMTKQTNEDLTWMLFGLVGMACEYLEINKTKTRHQGHS
eukprot:15345470-Ditylum_brightwellii.AAC.1